MLKRKEMCHLNATWDPKLNGKTLKDTWDGWQVSKSVCKLANSIGSIFPFMDHSLVLVKGLVQSSEAMSHVVQGQLRWTGHSKEVLTKCGLLEERMANHSSIIAARTPWTIWEDKNMWYQKISPPSWKLSNMLLWTSRGKLLTAPEKNGERNGNHYSCLENPMNKGA